MIDFSGFKISTVKPFRGQVLLEIVPEIKSNGGVVFPSGANVGAGGIVKHETEKWPGQKAIVRKIGEGTVTELGVGWTVIVPKGAGRMVNQPPRTFKLCQAKEVVAVFV